MTEREAEKLADSMVDHFVKAGVSTMTLGVEGDSFVVSMVRDGAETSNLEKIKFLYMCLTLAAGDGPLEERLGEVTEELAGVIIDCEETLSGTAHKRN